MIWTFCEINLDAQPLKWYYFFAHTLAVLSILGTAVYGIRARKKSLVGFGISTVLDYAFRIFLIAGFILCLYIVWNRAFMAYSGSRGYWNADAAIPFIAIYCLSFAFGIIGISVIIKYVWKISLNAILESIHFLIPKIPFLYDKSKESLLIIDKAIYGTPNANVDVTAVLNNMILDHTLAGVSSNALGGDPEPGIAKLLTINYRYKGMRLTKVFPEGTEIRLPLNN